MLKCPSLANKETMTAFGMIKFDEKGECRQLTKEQEQKFAHCVGYQVVVEEFKEVLKEEAPKAKKPAPKKPVKDE